MSTPDSTLGGGGDVPPDGGAVSDRIVAMLAEQKDVDGRDLEPIHDTVDLEAIDDLIEHRSDVTDRSLNLSLVVQGCQVVVHGDGSVVVRSIGSAETRVEDRGDSDR